MNLCQVIRGSLKECICDIKMYKKDIAYLQFLVWEMLAKLFRYRWNQDSEIFKTKIIVIRLWFSRILRHVYFLTWSCFSLFRGKLTIIAASRRFSMSHQFEDCKRERPANTTHQRYPAPRLWTMMKLVITVPLFVALLCVTAGMRNSVVKINSVFKSRCRFSKILPRAQIV